MTDVLNLDNIVDCSRFNDAYNGWQIAVNLYLVAGKRRIDAGSALFVFEGIATHYPDLKYEVSC